MPVCSARRVAVAHRSPTGVAGSPYSRLAQRGSVANASSVIAGTAGLSGVRISGSGAFSDWRSGWAASGTKRRTGRWASM